MRWVALCCLAACGRIGFDTTGDGGGGVDAGVPPEGNIAFVTSSTHVPGMLGTLGAADAICMARASDGGLDGTFRAWLSTTVITAPERLAGARGWYRVDGKPLVDTLTDLTSGLLLYPIRIDERGRDLGEDYTSYVATGTYGDGTLNLNCVDFTTTMEVVMSGYPQYAAGGFTNTDSPSCSNLARLYCFQTDYSRPLAFTRVTGRQAFVSSAAFTLSSGLAAADMVCATDAATAGLLGSFKALLPGTQSAAARFDPLGQPWVRVDGIQLAATAEALLRGNSIAPLDITAGGMVSETYVTTGLHTLSAYDPPDPLRTCDGWTNPNGTSTKGYSFATGGTLFGITSADCTGPVSVYCLEE